MRVQTNKCADTMPRRTKQVELTVTITVDGDANEAARLVADYLTQWDMPFESDYSPLAWGGWEGPIVTAVEVKTPAGTVKTDDSWGTVH